MLEHVDNNPPLTQKPASQKPASLIPLQLPWYWRACRLLILAYVGILLLLYFTQRKLIFPGAATQGQSKITQTGDAELVGLNTAKGDKIVALFGGALSREGMPLPDASKRPTLLFFYGNAMCLKDARQDFHNFRCLGLNVLIPEYVGYGMSSGLAGEAGCFATAEAAYEYLLARPGIDPAKIVASGWSLGGAVAINLASKKPLAGLATFSTFTGMAEAAHHSYPFIPTFVISLILEHPFKSGDKMSRVGCPVLIGHSHGDHLIPFEMADHLATLAKGPVTRISIETPEHGEFFSEGGEPVYRGIAEFMKQFQP